MRPLRQEYLRAQLLLDLSEMVRHQALQWYHSTACRAIPNQPGAYAQYSSDGLHPHWRTASALPRNSSRTSIGAFLASSSDTTSMSACHARRREMATSVPPCPSAVATCSRECSNGSMCERDIVRERHRERETSCERDIAAVVRSGQLHRAERAVNHPSICKYRLL